MEAIRLFYAWQSGHPRACRRLIHRALETAASELSQEFQVDAAQRPVPVQVDSDTRGVPGSPSVAETIFSKIAKCDIFVADLTLTQSDRRPAPNPNVLIEYGFALHAVGEGHVIGVMNTAFGEPEKLPFDIRHRRWPCRYSVGLDADKPQRAAAERELVESLKAAIGEIVKGRSGEEPDANAADAEEIPEPRNLWLEPMRMVRNDGETRVTLREWCPSITLEVAPVVPRPKAMTNSEMNRSAQHLFPLGFGGGDFGARFPDGIVRYASFAAEGAAVATVASALTSDGRLHGLDRETLRSTGVNDGIVPTTAVEDVLSSGLGGFLTVAADMGLAPPLQVWVKLEGVLNYRLGVD
ncbi:MAG: hypothetical protein F4Y01_14165, partial [Gammaproteobacteria bacterium]|nr:hypothetical protein [Gammaproteobacteria bacterium]